MKIQLIGYTIKNGTFAINHDYFKEVDNQQEIDQCSTELTEKLIREGYKDFRIQFITRTPPKSDYIPPKSKKKTVFTDTFNFRTDTFNLMRHGNRDQNQHRQ